MVKLADLSTGLSGERCCGVSLVAASSKPGAASDDDGGLPVDVLLQGETRLVIVRQGEDEPGKKLGSLVNNNRKRLFSKTERSDAIIVHGKPNRGTSLSFNLSTSKPGTLRRKTSQPVQDESAGPFGSSNGTVQQPNRTRVGFDFLNNMNEAADVSTDFTGRDVEAEMLDIMEIDQALDSMENSRGSGRKKVLFEED
jgi:hypothetical protein